MSPLLAEFIFNLGVALTKWGSSEIMKEHELSKAMAEDERKDGVRNGKNAKRYQDATTRADQVRAALDLLNRNN